MKITCTPTAPASILSGLNLIDVWTVENGLESMADIVNGSYAFKLENEAGENLGFYALKGENKPGGVVVWLVAGQGNVPGVDLTRDLLPEIEQQASGANFLAIQTTRPGLIKKLIEQGYEIGGTILVKKMK